MDLDQADDLIIVGFCQLVLKQLKNKNGTFSEKSCVTRGAKMCKKEVFRWISRCGEIAVFYLFLMFFQF